MADIDMRDKDYCFDLNRDDNDVAAFKGMTPLTFC